MLFRSWLTASDLLPLNRGEITQNKSVRFRTVGDVVCTAAIESTAKNVSEVIKEISVLNVTERGTRADDKTSETAMEDRKREGYF